MPHTLSSMSATGDTPESPSRGKLDPFKKFKIISGFIHSDAAGIKPGEDALALRARTQYRHPFVSRSLTTSPAASYRSPDTRPPVSQLWQPPRHGSISSDFSATSLGSNGSSSTNTTHASCSGSCSSCNSLVQETGVLNIHHPRANSLQCQQNREISPHYFHQRNPATSHGQGIPGQHVSAADGMPNESARAMGTELSTAVQHPSATTGTAFPNSGISHSAPTMQQSRSLPPSSPFITEPQPVSPGVVSHDLVMPPPSVVRSTSILSPIDRSFGSSMSRSTTCPSPKPVAMTRESSLQENPVNNSDPCEAPHEPAEDQASSGDARREASEPISNAPSNERQQTPPSDNEGTDDDSSSEPDDSESFSDDSYDSQEPLQKDFFKRILDPVKQHFLHRLLLYIANDRSLGVSLPMSLFFGCTRTVKPEASQPFTTPSCMHMDPLEHSNQYSDDDHDDHDGSVATDPKESPVSTVLGPSSRKANGKKPCLSANGHPERAGGSASRKRKSRATLSQDHNDDGNESDDEGEQGRGPRPRRSSSSSRGPEVRRIACPYFKRNPHGEPRADACFRNGFKDITKMKEHLERVHDRSIQCPRCFRVFGDQDKVSQHLRVAEDQMCERLQQQPHNDGYNASQAGRLKERMRSQSIEHKWKAIWRILFPTDPEEDIPSPWWVNRNELQGMEFYDRYERFVRERFPDRILRHLINLVDEIFQQPQLQQEVHSTVRHSLEEVYQEFRENNSTGQATQAPRQPPDGGASAQAAAAHRSAGLVEDTDTATLSMQHLTHIDPMLDFLNAYSGNISWEETPQTHRPMRDFEQHNVPTRMQPSETPQYLETPVSLLPDSNPTQLLEMAGADLTTSYVAVGALDTPVTHTPGQEWTNIDMPFNTNFDDLS